MGRVRKRPLVVVEQSGFVIQRDPGRPSGRLLRQDGMDSSYIDLADPSYLDFDYLRWIRAVLEIVRARRILHIGGAGCALARALAAADPTSRQEVVESDAAVLSLAREHLGLRHARGLRVRHGDGRDHVARQPSGSWDAVVLDAFVGATVPRHLITREALTDAARVAPLTLVNVVDNRGARDVRVVAAGLAVAYRSVWGLQGRSGNTVLVGTRTSIDLTRVRASTAADRSTPQLLGPKAVARLSAGTPAARDPGG